MKNNYNYVNNKPHKKNPKDIMIQMPKMLKIKMIN